MNVRDLSKESCVRNGNKLVLALKCRATALPDMARLEPRRYRSHSQHVEDVAHVEARMTRRERAETFDRLDDLAGRRLITNNDAAVGRAILRCASIRGRATPTYETLKRMTGLSTGTVSRALKRLEQHAGLRVVRRKARKQLRRRCCLTGAIVSFLALVQVSNLYVFARYVRDPVERQLVARMARPLDAVAGVMRRIVLTPAQRVSRWLAGASTVDEKIIEALPPLAGPRRAGAHLLQTDYMRRALARAI